MTDTYKGKTVVVTGAAGGLGRAIAQAFLSASANVVLVDVNPARLAACYSALSPAHPGRVLSLQVNITDESDVKEMIDTVVGKFSALDVLVNNAGVMDHYDPVGTLKRNVWDRVIAVNLTAPMLTSKYAVGRFLEQGKGGAILNVASTASLKGFISGAAYTASKHGVIGLTKNTAVYYAKKNIRCIAILPGPMKTNVADAFDDGFYEEGHKMMDTARAFEPEYCELNKVADTVLYLCSEAGSVCNGACVTVDNAWAAW